MTLLTKLMKATEGGRATLEAGRVFEVEYPFVLEDYSYYDEDGRSTTKSWRPGVRSEMVSPDDCEAVADGLGKMRLGIVSTHKPGRWPERIFFLRSWIAPDGKRFGKQKMRVATAQNFRALIRGYRHEYRLVNGVCMGVGDADD